MKTYITKLIAVAAIAFSTSAVLAKPSEGICYSVTNLGVLYKQALRDKATTVDKEIASIDKEHKQNKELAYFMRNTVYFTANNITLPEDTFRRLLYWRCMGNFNM